MNRQPRNRPARVLFLCTENSCRSQMAEGLLRLLGKENVEVFSAGSNPGTVHPLAVKSIAEIGIDLSQARSKSFQPFVGQEFDFVITVCDRMKERCPVWPSAIEHIHWSFDDPADAAGSEEKRLLAFRGVREGLRQRINLFLLANRIAENFRPGAAQP